MARTVEVKTIVPEVKPRVMHVVSKTCDGCGKPILDDDHGESCAHELIIHLDQDQCVNLFRQRDYCPACLESIWEGINQLIGVTEDRAWDERDQEYE